MTRNGPRDRLLRSAITLMCQRGVHETGLFELLANSRTARGSKYQHSPNDKSELIEQATYAAGRSIDAAGAVDGIITYWKHVLIDGDYAMGWPILAAAQPGPAVPAAPAAVFASWVDKIVAALTPAGAGRAVSSTIASAAVTAIEGATDHGRNMQQTLPLNDVATEVAHLIRSVVLASRQALTTSID